MRISQLISVFCLGIFYAASTFALQSPVLESNDVVLKDSTWSINGLDPYFVLSLESNTAQSQFLEIPISIDDYKQDIFTMELFFAPVEKSEAITRFDPLKRIRFDVELPIKDKRLVLELPDNAQVFNTTKVRIDLDGCSGCKVSGLSNARYLTEIQAPDSALKIAPHQIINDISSIAEQGLTINLKNWQSNNLLKTDFGYQINGGDPYLISPIIDVDINQLGGLLLELETNQSNNSINDFQLFYATEKHRFIEAASTIFRVQNKQGIIKVFIPFDFLKSQPQPAQLFRQLRLDIAQFSVFAKPNSQQSQWKLNEVKLVNQAQSSQYKSLIPSNLFQWKSQKAGKRKTLKGIFKKFANDWLFSVFYFTLIIVFCFLILFKLKKLN